MFRYELTMRLRQQDQLSPEQAFEKFEEAVSQFPPSEKKDIAKVIEFVMSMDYSSHPGLKSKTGYMNHPLRMAIFVAEMFTCDKVEGITTALVHNILEVTSVTIDDLTVVVGERVASNVDVLTVDRNCQKDPAYKTAYYRNIESRGLVAAAIKVLDKYDNLFLLGLNPDGEVREWYLKEIDKHVVPLAHFCEAIMPGIEKKSSRFAKKLDASVFSPKNCDRNYWTLIGNLIDHG